MISQEALEKMTLAEITATIKVNHNELALLNTEFAKRVTKTTDGQSFLSDDKVESAEYYLQDDRRGAGTGGDAHPAPPRAVHDAAQGLWR